MKKDDRDRRSFLKQMAAGSAIAATALSGKAIKAQEQETTRQKDEILYRETEDFTEYYKSLR